MAKGSLAMVRRDVHATEIAIEALPEGGTRTCVLEGEEASRPALSDDEARALADVGRRIERHDRAPQDPGLASAADGALWVLPSLDHTAAPAVAMERERDSYTTYEPARAIVAQRRAEVARRRGACGPRRRYFGG